MIALLAFLRRYWREIATVVLLAALVLLGWEMRNLAAQRDTARQADLQDKARLVLIQRQDAVTQHVDASATATAAHTQTVYRTITKEVTRYVASNPNSCVLSAGWVRIHNAAAAGQLAASAGAADAAE
ncbi:hypothetical protein [Paludibacterium purpuratum]|uniref:Uncharacterized protein n=1 Tax=Paludibacterium purpuratum TaxID=1144873 RepID=A0A4R7BB90_9NEIS|nr:hypothetical protein [Paludibacterium purpuratum]TDR82224.1 hypothetical protein DFP86_102338 [Paludibacterium purpuratum]